MNNSATVILALLGMSAVDLFLVKQQQPAQSRADGSQTITTLAELQPAMQHMAALGNPSPERAQRLFATWGEWRFGHVPAGARVSAGKSDFLTAPDAPARRARQLESSADGHPPAR